MNRTTIVVASLFLVAPSVHAQEVCSAERERAAATAVENVNASWQDSYDRDAIRWYRSASQWNAVLIDPMLWAAGDVEEKEILTRTAAVWVNCIVLPRERDLPKANHFAVDVYDAMSGRKLASIGIFRGFRIEG